MDLAAYLWSEHTAPYFVMASGHEPPFKTEVLNKVYRSVDDNGNRPGNTNGSFIYHKAGDTGLSLSTELE